MKMSVNLVHSKRKKLIVVYEYDEPFLCAISYSQAQAHTREDREVVTDRGGP